jgi:hypothetical protein
MRCHNRHNVTTSYSYTVHTCIGYNIYCIGLSIFHLLFVVLLSLTPTLTLNSQSLNLSISQSQHLLLICPPNFMLSKLKEDLHDRLAWKSLQTIDRRISNSWWPRLLPLIAASKEEQPNDHHQHKWYSIDSSH